MLSCTALLTVTITACATTGLTFSTTVSALRAPLLPASRTYWLISGMEGVGNDDLQFQEAKRLVVTALTQQWFVQAASPDAASQVIVLTYGIGNPTEQTYTYLAPQLGMVPRSTTLNGTITSTGNTSKVAATATTQSTLGITGLSSEVGTYTTYTRYLLVSSLDLDHYRVTKSVKELWKTGAVSTGSSGDLRLVLPYLVVASGVYFGKSTDHMIEQTIGEDDKRIIALKNSR